MKKEHNVTARKKFFVNSFVGMWKNKYKGIPTLELQKMLRRKLFLNEGTL